MQSARRQIFSVAAAADLCWFYANDLVRSFRANLNESKRRGEEENIQRDDNNAGERVSRVNTSHVRSWNSPCLHSSWLIFSVERVHSADDRCECEFVNKLSVFYGTGATLLVCLKILQSCEKQCKRVYALNSVSCSTF